MVGRRLSLITATATAAGLLTHTSHPRHGDERALERRQGEVRRT
jgi:hypothetical protein